MKTLIKNVRIVDCEKDFVGDLLIENGKIVDYGSQLDVIGDLIILGEDMVLMPSFVDLHAHFREPGFTEKETIESGSRAALKGGFTLVNIMGNTKPICSSMEVFNQVMDQSRDLDLIDIHQVVSVTKDFDGLDISHLDSLTNQVKCISDDGYGVMSNITMYKAMEKALEKDLLIMSHAEDMDLTKIDYRISENIMTARDIYLSEVTGARLHMSHVSTKEAIDMVRIGKAKGVKVTCEVTPHHISLYDRDYKVNPPIRKREDIEELIRGIKDGTVDAIATDHAPHTKEDKEEGAPGMSGIEVAFPISYTTLVAGNHIDLKKLSEIMSAKPAEILGYKKGRIEVGYDGDVVLVNLNNEIEIDGEKFISKGKNTPYNGMRFKGELIYTIKAGKIKYQKEDK